MSKTTAGGKKRIIFLLRDPFEHKYRVISSDKDITQDDIEKLKEIKKQLQEI